MAEMISTAPQEAVNSVPHFGAAQYPARPQFFAVKYLRLLIQCRVPTDLGQDVFCLLAAVVLREDELRYRIPPTMFTSDLMGTLGFKKWERLEAARERAGDWLHYEPPPKGSRRAGTYWVTIPAWVDAEGTNDAPDNTPQTDIDKSQSPSDGYCEGDREGYRKGDLLFPIPNPIPKKNTRAQPVIDPAFAEWYLLYPRKIAKQPAAKAFSAAIDRLTKRNDGNRDVALDWLKERTKAFAQSVSGQDGKFTPYPASWLNGERYDDDPKEWQKSTHGGPKDGRTNYNFDPSQPGYGKF